MRLKTFTAASLPEAMEMVRRSLGDDAVILSSEEDGAGGKARVTAAVEQEATDDVDYGALTGNMDSIDEISKALEYHRLPSGLLNRILEEASSVIEESDVIALASALDSTFSFRALPSDPSPRPLMLVGISGAGKTATAAKFCARARLSGNETSLITMDIVKAGGLAQVTAFAQALGTRLDQAGDATELRHAVRDCPDDHLVIVDTVGSSPFEPGDVQQLKEIAEAANAEVVLVLPAGGDAAEAAETALAFGEAGAKYMVPTKLDTARRLGGVLSAAHASGLTFMGAGNSPNIGGGLTSINPVVLARLILPATLAPEITEDPDLNEPFSFLTMDSKA